MKPSQCRGVFEGEIIQSLPRAVAEQPCRCDKPVNRPVAAPEPLQPPRQALPGFVYAERRKLAFASRIDLAREFAPPAGRRCCLLKMGIAVQCQFISKQKTLFQQAVIPDRVDHGMMMICGHYQQSDRYVRHCTDS